MKAMLRHGFWIGAVVSMAVYSLFQDFLGRDRFLAFARDGWVDATYGVPIAGGLLAAAASAYFFLRLRASDEDDLRDDDGPSEARKKTSGEMDDIIRRASGVRRG
jgi:hypothetical protein